jgi:hypothetical protein
MRLPIYVPSQNRRTEPRNPPIPTSQYLVIWSKRCPFAQEAESDEDGAASHARSAVRVLSLFNGMLPGNNAMVKTKRKETVPARRAAVGRSANAAKQKRQRSGPMLARDSLQVHVAAQSAVHKANVPQRGGPGVEAQIATPAAPGTQQRNADQIIPHAAPSGAPRTIALTRRADQTLPPWVRSAGRIRERSIEWQVCFRLL